VALGSTRTRIATACALVTAALAALATGVFGGPSDAGPGPAPAPGGLPADAVLRADPVTDPRLGKGGGGPRIFYLETTNPVDDIQPGPGYKVVEKCPKGSRVINGYYYQELDGVPTYRAFGLDDQGSSPRGFHKWAFWYDNVSGAEIDGVTFGIVCDKDG
jgi:hypothetical protein